MAKKQPQIQRVDAALTRRPAFRFRFRVVITIFILCLLFCLGWYLVQVNRDPSYIITEPSGQSAEPAETQQTQTTAAAQDPAV